MVGSYEDLGLGGLGYLQRSPRSPLMDVFSPTEACGHLLKFSGVIPMYQLPLCVSEKFALWSSLYCLDYKELTQMVLRLGLCECAWSFRMCMVLQIMSFNPYLSVCEGVGGVAFTSEGTRAWQVT